VRGLVVLAEVQRRPDLFQTLRVLADRRGQPARFLVLGSASPGLLRQSSHEAPHGGDLLAPPPCGASWEGFAIEEAIRAAGASGEECHFWAAHTGAELDLLVVRG